MPSKATLNAEQLMGEKAVAAPETLLQSDAGASQGGGQLAQAFSVEAPLELNRAEATSAPKTFNMQNIKNADADSILTQVSDYIVQARAAKEPTVQMRVNHQDLGMIDITVSRTANDMVSIVLGTQDNGAKMFLGQNRESLMSHLSQAGVNVSDLKMEQSSQSKDSSNGQNLQQGGQQGSGRQFGSEQNQRRDEQQRRQDLWEATREKEVA
jgi:flagellar hook-length control protein FliK